MRIKTKIILATQKQYKYLEDKLIKTGSPSFNLVSPPVADLGIQDVLFFKGFSFIKTDTKNIWKKFKVISIRHLGNNFAKWRKAVYKTLVL